MEKATRFEELWIWQQARELVQAIYHDVAIGAVAGRDYGFKGQLQRAGISIMNNIAEGFERYTNVEFARFLDISKGSCGEVRSLYYVAEDLQYISKEVATERRMVARKISAGILTLAAHVRSSQQ